MVLSINRTQGKEICIYHTCTVDVNKSHTSGIALFMHSYIRLHK